MSECCKDLGNWFFQYLRQDNKKVYECCECYEIHIWAGIFLEIEQKEE